MNRLFLILVILLSPFSAQAESSHLKVGLVGQEPFVMEQTGIAPELWEAVVADYNTNNKDNLSFEYFVVGENVDAGIERTNKGDIDVLVGPITINAKRSESVFFTQPFYESKMAVMTLESVDFMSIVGPFLKRNFWKGIMIFLGSLFLFGTSVWIVERKYNSSHFRRGWQNIVWDGCWFVLVTITTTGYGDKTTITRLGKAISSLLMVVSYAKLPIIMGFTLIFSQDFTQDISLDRQKAAVVSGTTGAKWAETTKAKLKYETSFKEAMISLQDGKVEAVVFDAPALHYHLSINQDTLENFEVYEQSLSESYGLAIHDQELAHKLNLSLLRVMESGALKGITNKWLFH